MENTKDMNHWFSKLKFKSFGLELGHVMTELDNFADYKFENGISIRVITGLEANTTPQAPYEMIIYFPNPRTEHISFMSRGMVVDKMEQLNHIIILE
jgi:hypothetical protein